MISQQIIKDFQKYMEKSGGSYRDWYVGITANPEQRLFTDHDVDRQHGSWIHAPGDTNQVARLVEEYFLNLGCDGGGGGGDNSSTTVYAYKKTVA